VLLGKKGEYVQIYRTHFSFRLKRWKKLKCARIKDMQLFQSLGETEEGQLYAPLNPSFPLPYISDPQVQSSEACSAPRSAECLDQLY